MCVPGDIHSDDTVESYVTLYHTGIEGTSVLRQPASG